MGKTFHIHTLGCKVNQYESQALREAWQGLGYVESLFPRDADYIIVNSCAITAKAVSDLRAVLRRLHKSQPKAAIIVTGCAAQLQAECLEDFPGVSRVIFQKDKARLLAGPCLPGEAAGEGADFFISGFERSRAVLKIQDGCSHACAYCIVPSTRGKSRSRPVEDCVAEVGRLLASGFREIVLSGVNLRQYEYAHKDFWDLVAALEAAFGQAWSGKARFRISSLEPGQLHAKALQTLKESRLIAPQLHISMQSGSQDVLNKMGRGHYKPEQLSDFLHDLSGVWPVFGLGADFIAGFPGETDEDHGKTLAFIEKLPFTYAHIFPYSVRPGTRAASMPGQVSHERKKTRAAELRSLAKEKKDGFAKAMLNLPLQNVVFEDRKEGVEEELQGVNEYYVDCRALPQEAIHPREITAVRPKGISRGIFWVEKA